MPTEQELTDMTACIELMVADKVFDKYPYAKPIAVVDGKMVYELDGKTQSVSPIKKSLIIDQ